MNALTRTEIVRLSPSERLALIADLWDSLSDGEVPVTSAQMAEIESGLASFDADRAEARSWEQLKVELSSRIW